MDYQPSETLNDEGAALRPFSAVSSPNREILQDKTILSGPFATTLFDQAAAAAAKIGLWSCDLASQSLSWTDGVYDMFELPRGAPIGRTDVIGLYDEDSRRELEDLRTAAIRKSVQFSLEAHIITARGRDRWIRIHANVSGGKEPKRLIGLKQDITEEKARIDLWRSKAEHDPLTGLANRAKFETTLNEMINGDRQVLLPGALLFVDLDNFKQINDTFGHAAGDACLIEIGTRLRKVFRHARLIARVGGDEFALLIDRPSDLVLLEGSVREFLVDVGCPFKWKRRSLTLGASIGIAAFPGPKAASRPQICKQADQALYDAKSAGRNTYRFFPSNSASVGSNAP